MSFGIIFYYILREYGDDHALVAAPQSHTGTITAQQPPFSSQVQ